VTVEVSAAWVVTAFLAGGVVTYALTRPSTAAASPANCPLDEKSFHDWASARGYASIYLQKQQPPPPGVAELVKTWSLDTVTSPIVVACGDGSLWYYADNKTAPARRDDLRAQYCSAQKTAGVSGLDPASLFLV
jgi:hypothetical protein